MDRRNNNHQIIRMSTKQKKFTYINFLNITAAAWAAVMFLFLPSCGGKKQNLADAVSEGDSLPDMHTTGVTTLISDSGLIRYKIVTEEWLIYSKRNPPFWAFEKGLYMEKFDTLFHIDASIKADTAYYYEIKKLWELRGNVHIQSQRGDKFDTQLMYWDQGKEKIYSDRFIRIEQPDGLLMGYGFESNQTMTEYQVFNSSGTRIVEDKAPQDTTQTNQQRN